jgi:hypothetical protein
VLPPFPVPPEDPEVDEAQAARRANSGARALVFVRIFIGGSSVPGGRELSQLHSRVGGGWAM